MRKTHCSEFFSFLISEGYFWIQTSNTRPQGDCPYLVRSLYNPQIRAISRQALSISGQVSALS